MDILTVGALLITAFAVANIFFTLYDKRDEFGFIWQVWKRYRVWMFIQAIGVFAALFLASFLLLKVPGLKYGWASLFFEGGGNVLLRPLTEGSKSSNRLIQLLPIFFLSGLLFAIPFWAKWEEDIFRKGYDDWAAIGKRSIIFGLTHCIAGIPLAFGLVMTIMGLFYAYHYKRVLDKNVRQLGYDKAQEEAIMESTVYHSVCNTIIVSLLLGGAIYAAL